MIYKCTSASFYGGLQVTFQACSIYEARYLYDQLATFCPIVVSRQKQVLALCLWSSPLFFCIYLLKKVLYPEYCVCFLQMALSAASPFYRGYVSDIDCRWGVISASVDDRTQEERGLKVSRRSWKQPEKKHHVKIDLGYKDFSEQSEMVSVLYNVSHH